MRKRLGLATLSGALFLTALGAAKSEDDGKAGARLYRACAGCHSLEPGIHLTGPSLAGMWGKKAATVEDFPRYSPALKVPISPGTKTASTPGWRIPLNSCAATTWWFAASMDNEARGNLIAFLKQAMAPGGAKAVVEEGLISKEIAIGQRPEPLRDAGADQRVTVIRHCQSTYFVNTADGTERPYWEMNVRLKTDTASTGPMPEQPVIVGAGMMGDRVSIVFASPEEIGKFVKSQC